jgi:hypothetical protein
MKKKIIDSRLRNVCAGLSAVAAAPGVALGCACGCGVFDVATSSMLPEGPGGMAYFELAYQDQNRNWSGTSWSPSVDNGDKKIETAFETIGLQYMFNRSWGAELELPFASRNFKTEDAAGAVVDRRWDAFGDIRLKAIYTGFSPDMSSGLTFGLKLPSGSDNRLADVVDRDSEIGSGSTDVLLGAFTRGEFGSSPWNWYGQGELDMPFLKQGDYRPGVEADVAWGIYYEGLTLGRARITPIAQIIGSWRGRDNGAAANPDDSGYQRVMLSPGIEIHVHPVTFYADVEIPVYDHVTGNQLIAPVLFKLSLSYMF